MTKSGFSCFAASTASSPVEINLQTLYPDMVNDRCIEYALMASSSTISILILRFILDDLSGRRLVESYEKFCAFCTIKYKRPMKLMFGQGFNDLNS